MWPYGSLPLPKILYMKEWENKNFTTNPFLWKSEKLRITTEDETLTTLLTMEISTKLERESSFSSSDKSWKNNNHAVIIKIIQHQNININPQLSVIGSTSLALP